MRLLQGPKTHVFYQVMSFTYISIFKLRRALAKRYRNVEKGIFSKHGAPKLLRKERKMGGKKTGSQTMGPDSPVLPKTYAEPLGFLRKVLWKVSHPCRVRKKGGVFWKRGLLRKVDLPEILENLEKLENPPDSGKQRGIQTLVPIT